MEIPRSLERPWTPPEIEDRPYARTRPSRLNLYGDSPSQYSRKEQRWPNDADRVHEQPSWTTETYSPRTPFTTSRPKLSSRLTEPLPYTPKKQYHFDEPYSQPRGVPRYPYTPDSSQTLRRHTVIPASPPPWDDYSDPALSPVQDALSACIAQFEDLIQSQQPDEDQMEYIVGQFEAMAMRLSAPESYEKESGTQYPSHFDQGAGIMHADDGKDDLAEAKRLYHQSYVAEVGNYVNSVQKYVDELRKRLDEVKTLNSIQLDVINDLRKQMKTVRQNMREGLERKKPGGGGKSSAKDMGRKDESTPRKFGMMDSWQTLVNDDDDENNQDVSQDIHNEYTKLVRSAVYNLTAEDNNDRNDDDAAAYHTPRPPPPAAAAARPVIRQTKRRLITIVRSPPRRSFWASIGEALDAMSELLLEE
ncbi:hypothetical protein COCC4DRAFT_183940 [Bipolaris maydis ATCC 48331]|uniref:Uncharacterized protein n=2 Tax=Cochliobolus heterostrophus TaxID=5016 RepID=M2V896_COCH5|nr:uncharacterized protein COCC4DRAFT_183940 [Bipolaris maydis ATCC 48331]EMD95958.1 hypothetical protein COCHEDRAFT_1127245 [Bipolaris maydis C5]ENI10817.1 hypothetical protein COCC4DRAFT_183940 [Bipolaris maydis ATCC 48331]KAJ6213261.1 hypothetical protein PSV09DRAFT_1127245 [Bipolaris maydis]